jgi:hypothetical protein
MRAGAESPHIQSPWPEFLPGFVRRRGMSRATQVILVCSARARIGKTLLSRLIVEYCRADAQPVAAYTINPIDVALGDFLPDVVSTVSLAETRGQMALFDRLVIDDATIKIVDIGHQALDKFFTLAYDIEFAAEARGRGIDVIVAYVADPSDLSTRTYAALQARFPEFAFVPVFNDAVARGIEFHNMFPARPGGTQPLHLPKMSPQVHGIADHHPFSFIQFLRSPPSNLPRALLDEVDSFVKRFNRQWRETELSLLLNRLRASLSDNSRTAEEI